MPVGRRARRGGLGRSWTAGTPLLLAVLASFALAVSCDRTGGEIVSPNPSAADPSAAEPDPSSVRTESKSEPAADPSAVSWTIEPPGLDLGLVGAEEEKVAHFSIENSGRDPLRVVEVVKSCGCLRPAYEQLEVPAGGSQDFEVALTTDGRSAHEYSVQVSVKQSGVVTRKTLYLRYTPKPRPQLEPPALHLGFARVGAKVERDVRFELRVPGREIEASILCDVPADLPVSVLCAEPEVEDLGGSYRVRGTLHFTLDSARPGRFDGRVSVRTAQSEPSMLLVKGVVHSGAYFESDQIHLGKLPTGSRRSKDLTLHGDPEVLSAVTLESDTDWVSVEAEPFDGSSNQRRFRVTLRPPAAAAEEECLIRLDVRGPLDAPVFLELRAALSAPRADRGSAP